jgi:tetratricopeptide (TPR) repeat protein
VRSEHVVDEAKRLIEEDRCANARELLITWLEEHPDDGAAWAVLGAAEFNLKNFESAKDAAEKVTLLRPDNAQDWCNLGTILRKLRHFAAAAKAQRRALELDPAHERAREELTKIQSAPSEKCWKCGAKIFATDAQCMACGSTRQKRKSKDDAHPIAEADRAAVKTKSEPIASVVAGAQIVADRQAELEPEEGATGLDYWLPARALSDCGGLWFATVLLPLGWVVALAFWGLGWWGLAVCKTRTGRMAAQRIVSTALLWLIVWCVIYTIAVLIILIRVWG